MINMKPFSAICWIIPVISVFRSVLERVSNMPPPTMFQQMHQQVRDKQGRDGNNRPPPLWQRDVRMYGAIELVDGRWLNFSSLADREPPTCHCVPS